MHYKRAQKSSVVCNNVVYWSVLGINCLSPFMFACLLTYGNFYLYKTKNAHGPPNWFNPAYLVVKYTIGTEQMISGIVLILAVFIMRKYLMENGLDS